MQPLTARRPVRFGFALILVAMAAMAQSTDQKIEDLQTKVNQLEQKLAGAQPAATSSPDASQPKTGITTSAGPEGFVLRSADGNFIWRFGLDFQVDNRAFPGESNVALPDGILIRRARPTFSGTIYKYIDFYVRPDFGQGQTVLYEAYAQLNYFKHVNLRFGKFKPPVGLERLQSDDDTSFVERGLPTLLVPSRDIGFQLAGDIWTQRIGYQVGVFNGVPDNSLSDSAPSDHRDYAARLFFTPFFPEKKNPLRGLGFGLAATGGNVDGIALPSYKSFGQNTFITFASGVTSAGHRTRLAPQMYYYLGPFGLLSEYTISEEGFQKGAVRRDIALRSWQVGASYILTGERKVFNTLTPRRPFDPHNRQWGAVEIAVRTAGFSVEKGLFNYGLASSTNSARMAREWIGGVNWYLNRMLRISLDYGNTNFEGGATTGNRSSERALITRFQVNIS